MGRTACTEPQCLYKGDLYLYLYPNKQTVVTAANVLPRLLYTAQSGCQGGVAVVTDVADADVGPGDHYRRYRG